ncbi:MAG: carboxylating nicotinate-nucleotide diphosphorylase [Woeseia sp.]
MQQQLQDEVRRNVAAALAEDVGSGDLTAALLDTSTAARAKIIAREDMVLAGQPWVNEVFRQLDSRIASEWLASDGATVKAGATVCRLSGPARALLTGERSALNFLQTLSATATATSQYVAAVAHTGARILDTRKTIPGLRQAQKYAVRCGGGMNHRQGLFDAILIKENHIAAAGSIATAVAAARAVNSEVLLEVEVESTEQLREALAADVRRVLLDNFDLAGLAEAVAINRAEGRPPAELEASGGLTIDELRAVAETGVDYISTGAITKHVRAIDLSIRFDKATRRVGD